ncbi:MAG: hypothetical protein KGD73_05900 [Candidatus Lokiarchaeota archaeon]|nr:hypothetical protein [Candidatus Lokiarchaeota archaeon]
MKATVKKSHMSDVLNPFKAKKGEFVQGEERPTQWEGWIYCKNKDGVNGWAPKVFLRQIDNNPGKYQFIRSYNAIEISAFEGDSVEIKETESGWAWVVNIKGEDGWIPLVNLDLEV